MADHSITVQLYYNGSWNTVPAYSRDGITLSRGAGGEGQESPPSTAAVTLANPTGALSPTNASGALYGAVGRNTPLRILADGVVQSTTEVAGWGLDRELKTGADAWVKAQGTGILRRLQQGKTPLRSALERVIRTSSPTAFWPLNETKDSTLFLSAVAGGDTITVNNVLPGEVDGPAGTTSKFPDVAYRGTLSNSRGPIPAGLPATGWGVEFIGYIGRPAGPNVFGSTNVLNFNVSLSSLWRVELGVDASTGPYIIVFGDINGNTSAGVFRTGLTYGWHHFRLTMAQSGGNVVQTLYVDGNNTGGASDNETTAGTLGPPIGDLILGQYVTTPFTDYLEQAAVGMVAFYAAAADHSGAAFGYTGETAGARFTRICGEQGVTATIVGTSSDTQAMGPQPEAPFVDVIREIVRTDDGLLWDDRGLTFRTGRSLRNQNAVATLSFIGGQFARGLVPVIDDANTRNDVTATGPTGATARATKTTGPMNVNDPISDPEGIGRYDSSISVNPDSVEDLAFHAYWHLSKGTVEAPRYPTITIDLDARPDLIAAVDALAIGDRFDLSNLPADWSMSTVALILLGVRNNFPSNAGDYRRLVTLTAASAEPYEVLLTGDTAGSTNLRGARVGTLSTVTSGSHAAGVTSIAVNSNGIEWTTAASDFNTALNGGGMFVDLAGETVRVTAIAGAGSAWTFTVVRSVNGVSKTIPSGTRVKLLNPGRLGL